MMEQVVQGATNLKDGQECENHSLLIPGCAKFPLSRVMYKQVSFTDFAYFGDVSRAFSVHGTSRDI